MEDSRIIALYWQRDESAIAETDHKYGGLCRSIAANLLSDRRDAEECVSDCYHHAWNAMPPQRPDSLRAWLGRVVRNLSIDRFRAGRAKRRFDGTEQLLSELADCIPTPDSTAQATETAALTQAINCWLAGLAPGDRALFVRRYWYGEPLQVLAQAASVPPNRLAQRMRRLRAGLKTALEKEGFIL